MFRVKANNGTYFKKSLTSSGLMSCWESHQHLGLSSSPAIKDIFRLSSIWLTIHKTASHAGGLVRRCTEISSFPRMAMKQFQFHEERGLQEESSHSPWKWNLKQDEHSKVTSRVGILLQQVNFLSYSQNKIPIPIGVLGIWSPVLSSSFWQGQMQTLQYGLAPSFPRGIWESSS